MDSRTRKHAEVEVDDRVLATIAELEARLAGLLAHLHYGDAVPEQAAASGPRPALVAHPSPDHAPPSPDHAPPSPLRPGPGAVPLERLEAFARHMGAVFAELTAELAGLMGVAGGPKPAAASPDHDGRVGAGDLQVDDSMVENAAALSTPGSGAPPVYPAGGHSHPPAAHWAPAAADLAPPSTHDQVFGGSLVVDAGPFAEVTDLRAFEAAIQAVAGAGGVYLRSFMADRALLDVDLAQPLRLGRELRAVLPYPFALFESGEGRVTINVDAVGSR